MFLIFTYTLFAVIGMHEFGDNLFNRCRNQSTPEIPGLSWSIVDGDSRSCTDTGQGRHICLPENFCGNPFDVGITLANDGVFSNP